MWRTVRAIVWFLAFCAFFSLAFTRFYAVADLLLSAVLVGGIIVMTGVKLWKMWKHRADPQLSEAYLSSGQGGIFGRRWRRWVLDEDDPTEGASRSIRSGADPRRSRS